MRRWANIAQQRAKQHSLLLYVILLLGLLALALWSRYRYVLGDYTFTFGSGDAHLILVKALFLREGIVQPSPELVPVTEIFDQPPLIPLLLGSISLISSIPLATVPLVVVPLITTAALFAFFDFVRRTFDVATAVISTGLLALLPRFSFDSTEPEKMPFVVSFSVIALWLLVLSRQRSWLLPLAGLFLGLAVFSHTTGYFFVPVFVLAYFSMRGLSRRTAFEPLFLSSLMIPAFFIAVYFMLAKLGAPTVTTTGEAVNIGLLPGFVQLYVDIFTDMVAGGITERAWNLYFEGIRHQLTTPVYAAGIAGLILATAITIRTRRLQMMPVLLWMVILTLGFAMQFPASSHGSRYPGYVTPVFLVMAAFLVVSVFRWMMSGHRLKLLAAPAAIALLIAVVGLPMFSYATAANPGLRDLYGGHRDLADFIASEGILDDGSHILYLGWPSVTLYLLEHNIDYNDQIHSFGFGLRDLEEFTPEFITANNIRYYADNHIANDGFDSANVVMTMLLENFTMTQLGRFERRLGNFITLFAIGNPAQFDEGALQAYLSESNAEARAASLTANPSLIWQGNISLADWDPNGVVVLEPLATGGPSGVLVRNNEQFGGIRQLIDVSSLGQRTVTAIVRLRSAGEEPARSVVLSLSREGTAPFSQIFVPLSPGDNVITLEIDLPADVNILRFTVATGKGDEGDLIIEQAHLVAEPLQELLNDAPKPTPVSSFPG